MDMDPNIKPFLVWVVHGCIHINEPPSNILEKEEGMNEQYKS